MIGALLGALRPRAHGILIAKDVFVHFPFVHELVS